MYFIICETDNDFLLDENVNKLDNVIFGTLYIQQAFIF